MNKKIGLFDYFFMFAFILILVASVGAFFFGLKMGIDKTQTKYEAILLQQQAIAGELTQYHQQYLVSFYYTVYEPYTNFVERWSASSSEILNPNKKSSTLKSLSAELDKSKKELSHASIPNVSPLLSSAFSKYSKSLSAYEKTISDLKKSADPSVEMAKSENHLNAQTLGLNAQSDFFAAIIKWNDTISPNVENSSLISKSDLTFKEWGTLELNYKNGYIAKLLSSNQYVGEFLAQDLTAKIDESIENGTHAELKSTTINSLAKTLIAIKAVRNGDYLSKKEQYYANEQLPNIPFLMGKN